MARFRNIKHSVREWLLSDGWRERLGADMAAMSARELIGPLFALLLDPEEVVRWRAVTALGATVARMADADMERARVVMRRFLWHMNEESGNVGWGIPEAMGEAMARHPRLADEYHKNLASYVQCPECLGDDNYMDHPPLRRATYWGLARLAQDRPELVCHAAAELVSALDGEEDPLSRGLACLALGLMGQRSAAPRLEELARSTDPLDLYWNGDLKQTTLGELAAEALAALGQGAAE
ncbi:DVU0298 family protein [Desulfocurvus sp. DL9XJH121]